VALHRPQRWHPLLGMSSLLVAVAFLALSTLAYAGTPLMVEDASPLRYLLPGMASLLCLALGAWALSGPTRTTVDQKLP
jgi:hypothetical protein